MLLCVRRGQARAGWGGRRGRVAPAPDAGLGLFGRRALSAGEAARTGTVDLDKFIVVVYDLC